MIDTLCEYCARAGGGLSSHRVVRERGLHCCVAAPVTRVPECASYTGWDERGSGVKIQSMQNHTGTCCKDIDPHRPHIYQDEEVGHC